MELNKKEYGQYVKKVTPPNPLFSGMLKAFLVGGIICALGQISVNLMKNVWGMDQETATCWMQIELIVASIILTGLNLYPKLVQWGGAGALVPISGFANSVVAPAIEYKAEGHVFGIGVKIFTIAGPVILFGVFAGWLLGIIYYFFGIGASVS